MLVQWIVYNPTSVQETFGVLFSMEMLFSQDSWKASSSWVKGLTCDWPAPSDPERDFKKLHWMDGRLDMKMI